MFELLARQMWHQTEPVNAVLYLAPEAQEEAAKPWRALGEAGAGRLTHLNRPLLGAVFESGMLPPASTLGIGKVQVPA
ncbi:hypothetical protein [Kitasatospora sp. P5_F3]